MSDLKDQLRAELTAAMKARNMLTTGTLRMILAAITNEEVAGAQSKQLSDADVIRVLAREVKKRNESAEIYAQADRQELAGKELAEVQVISQYLPQQLSDDELADLVRTAVGEAVSGGDAPSMKQMGVVIKAVQAKAAGRADGSRIAAAVKSAFAG